MPYPLVRGAVAAAVALAALVPAHADDITPDPYRDLPRAAQSRADVKAAFNADPAAGAATAADDEDSGSFALARKRHDALTTRSAVVAQVHAARASGELAALNGERGAAAF